MNTKSIIFLVIVAGLAFGGVWYYKNYYVVSDSEPDTMSATVVSTQKRIGTRTIQLLNQVNSLTLDTEFFETPAFSFTSYEVEIPDQPVGRPNPFAPLPKKASSTKDINLPPITY